MISRKSRHHHRVANAVQRVALLAALGRKSPLEVWDRLLAIADVWLERGRVAVPAYQSQPLKDVLARMERLGLSLTSYLEDSELAQVERRVWQGVRALAPVAPFPTHHNADITIARMCYLICRASKPNLVMETGVAYGVNSAFILAALDANGQGRLHSIDLPPLGRNADQFVGVLIPDGLRSRWVLHRGMSKRVLPKLLPTLGVIDVFVHDSLHTYRNIQRELSMVRQYMAGSAFIVVDDVEGNAAFADWAQTRNPTFWAAVDQPTKHGVFGVALLR
jgi:predicted O-methyltransferase YrrM